MSVAEHKSLTILNLFGSQLSNFGDAGNLLVLRKRCKWRGIAVKQLDFEAGDSPEKCKGAHLILSGGGTDRGLAQIKDDFLRIAPLLRSLVEEGVPALAVCTSYQLFGEYLETSEGKRLEGAGIFSLHTLRGIERQAGNIVISNSDFGELIGYENHSGLTFLHEGQEPLAQVVSGFGNNGKDGTEGARYKNALGTYLHGPLLPKNPQVADFLIAAALEYCSGEPVELPPLPDQWVTQALTAAKTRPR